ncbi:unnamed protein product [Trifolium pratense]|uniref:Uncharacterized protein n=1 Tax=Trifolium pratense TaxID=57577 RepID=A0ACB0LUI6_TRIPR|nr:unnamed protein product [Trifolium pratense]
MKSIELEKMSMDNKTPSVSKKNENEKQPSPHSSAVNEKEDQLPSSSVVNEKEENPQPCSKKKKNKNVELLHSNASPRSSSSCVRHPIQLGQLQWKGLPNTYTGLHHSPFLVIRPVGLGNLNHRSGGIYIPPSSLNNIASSLNQSLNLHYQIDIDKIICGEDTRTTLMILNIPYNYTSEMLLLEIKENHHKIYGTYDFIFFPKDSKNNCNLGYAFINMLSHLHVVPFYKAFHEKKWDKFTSDKVATLAYAQIQGKAEELAKHFDKRTNKPKKIMIRNYLHPAT